MDLVKKVEADFRSKFGAKPLLVLAPGRINLIGEHTDYNDGFVMPAAIDRHLVFGVALSGTDKCNIYAQEFSEGITFSVRDLNPGEVWVNYLMGVMDAFHRQGLPIRGVDCVLAGNIPAGAGLSSSAALCCGFGFALNELFHLGLSRLEVAKVAQHAEHHFAGARVGLMDQYASLFGKEDSVLLLDCRALTHHYFPFVFPETDIVLIDTKVKHSLGSSAYNDRRASCEEGVRILRKYHPDITSLRDASRLLLDEHQDELGEEIYIKCGYIVEEINRTQQAGVFLKNKNLQGFGDLMYQTHWGLSQAYDVSCEELDFLVSLAEEDRKVVMGSRMMGGGFGGCTINLVVKGREETFKEQVRQKYFATFKMEPDFYNVKLSNGIHTLQNPKA
jgi:galactokinase